MDPSTLSHLAQTGLEQQQSSQTVQVNYGASLTSDMASFAQHLDKAEAAASVSAPAEPSAAAKALFKPLDRINIEAQELVQYAQEATASGNELSASEIVMLTVRSQEFMFHSQLTANVANRTADGLQQLFRQQG